MKKLILSVFMIMVVMLNAYSQTGDKTITLKKRKYYQNDQVISGSQFKTILANNPASAMEFKKMKTNATIGSVFFGLGTVACIYAIANPPSEMKGSLHGLISDAEMSKHMTPLYIGAGLIVIGTPFIFSSKKHFKKSISDYNSSLKTVSYEPVQFNLLVNSNGLGVRMVF